VAFSPDGRWLAAADAAEIRLWDGARERAPWPERPRPGWSEDQWLAWQQRQAAAYEAEGQWALAYWYLNLNPSSKQGGRQELLTLRPRLARAQAEYADWNNAAFEYAEAIKLNGEDIDLRYKQALAQLGGADRLRRFRPQPGEPPYAERARRDEQVRRRNDYRRTCASLLERFGKSEDPATAHLAARACALAPEAVADFTQPLQLAERAAASEPNNHTRLTTLAAVLYRAGRFDAALQRLNEATALAGSEDTPRDWLLLALTQQRLGRVETARQWLGKATRWIEQAADDRAQEASAAASLSWEQRLEIELLYQEAEELVNGARP
jgi:hypothetical protein